MGHAVILDVIGCLLFPEAALLLNLNQDIVVFIR